MKKRIQKQIYSFSQTKSSLFNLTGKTSFSESQQNLFQDFQANLVSLQSLNPNVLPFTTTFTNEINDFLFHQRSLLFQPLINQVLTLLIDHTSQSLSKDSQALQRLKILHKPLKNSTKSFQSLYQNQNKKSLNPSHSSHLQPLPESLQDPQSLSQPLQEPTFGIQYSQELKSQKRYQVKQLLTDSSFKLLNLGYRKSVLDLQRRTLGRDLDLSYNIFKTDFKISKKKQKQNRNLGEESERGQVEAEVVLYQMKMMRVIEQSEFQRKKSLDNGMGGRGLRELREYLMKKNGHKQDWKALGIWYFVDEGN